MAAKNWILSRVYAALESVFGTDPDSTGAAYKFLKVLPDSTWQPTMDVIPRPALINDMTRLPHVMGSKSGKLSLKVELKGSATAASNGVAAIAAEADGLLQAIMGTVVRGTGDLVQAGSTTTVINVVTGASFSKYMMVMIDCGATYGFVPRFITSISSNALTLDRALPATPGTGVAIHASSKYTRANTGHQSLAIAAYRDDILYTFLGCKVDSAKLSGISARGTAILDVQLSVTDWNTTAKGSIPSAVPSGITNAKAPVVKGSCFAIGGTEEYAHTLEFDFGTKFEFQDSTCGLGPAVPDSTNTGQQLTAAEPKGSVSPYYASSHLTDHIAATERSLMFATPGTGVAWGIYVPKAQWTGPEFEDHNGMVTEKMPFMVNDNGTDPEYALCVC